MPNLTLDPYPNLPRTLVVQVGTTDFVKAKNATLTNMDPRTFLLSLDPALDALVSPPTPSPVFLFNPGQNPPTNLRPAVFSFLGFQFPSLGPAIQKLAEFEHYMLNAGDNRHIQRVYVQGVFVPPTAKPADPGIGTQGYVKPASQGGIDARHAWASGAAGRGLTLRILESSWWARHADFVRAPGSVGPSLSAYPGMDASFSDDLGLRQHGTGTLGIVLASANKIGVRGIAHEASAKLAKATPGSLQAVNDALSAILVDPSLSEGSIVLLEMSVTLSGTNVFLPIEGDPSLAVLIQQLVDPPGASPSGMGAVVIQAAGNSDTDLDLFLTDPTGAIIVGASRAPADLGTRTALSNYSTTGKVQLWSWGKNVGTTCVKPKNQAVAPLSDADFKSSYASMSETSAASAIIAGAALCVQRWTIDKTGGRLDNKTMLEALRAGTPCQSGEGIGMQPDLAQIII